MGISIQTYRCRIGTYVPKNRLKLQKNSYKCTSCRYTTYPRNLISARLFVMFILIVSSFYSLANHSHQQNLSTFGLVKLNYTKSSLADFLGYMPPYINIPNSKCTSNFYARYTYGNRSNRFIKLSHWNAGSAFLENKINDIENVIATHHPHLLGISEANLHKNHSLDNCKIDDYEIITSKTLTNMNLQVSRVVVYKHTSLVAKVREDLMSDKFSSIWLEVGFPGRTRFLVCNLYRDWQYLGQSDHTSLEISEQLARWIIFLEQWELALNTGKECIVTGDFNIDFLNFYRSDLPSNSVIQTSIIGKMSFSLELFHME